MYGIIERYVSTTTCAIKTLNEKKNAKMYVYGFIRIFLGFPCYCICIQENIRNLIFFYLPLRPELANIRLGEFNS